MLRSPVLGCHPIGPYVGEVRAIGVEYPIDRVAPTRGYPSPGQAHGLPSSKAVPHGTIDIKFARSGSAIRVSFSRCSHWFDPRYSSLPGGHEVRARAVISSGPGLFGLPLFGDNRHE